MKRSNIAILMLASLTIACGVDVTDPQAGYFDDHQDKSGTQNFNNMGSGTMNVNITNNNQTTQPTVVNNVVPSASQSASKTGYLIAGMQFEYIDNYVYATNLHNVTVKCDVSYRANAPKNGYLDFVQSNMSDSFYVWTNDSCITITSVSCNDYFKYNNISSWVGNQTICQL